MLHGAGPNVISLASTKEQADIVYGRVKYCIDANPALSRRYKTTGTRGIKARNPAAPASYVIKAGDEKGLQGVTVSLCLYDEIHITKEQTWDAVVFGTSSPHPKGRIIIGITTAGDSNSVLLKRLYEQGHAAAAGTGDERFGFFLWEAPEHTDISNDDQLEYALKAANPAIACGRMDIVQEMSNVRAMPETRARRYRLNQFVAAEATWLPMSLWNRLQTATIPVEHRNNIVVAVARTPNWGFATVTAGVKVGNKVYTEMLAQIPDPNVDNLEDICVAINKKYRPHRFVMANDTLRDLAYRLKDRGLDAEYLTANQLANVSATAYSLISNGLVVHANDAAVNKQLPKAVLHSAAKGEYRLSDKNSAGDIDAVQAMTQVLWAAENVKPRGPAILF